MSSKKRPNFLIIVADDLGFSDIGAFGSEIKTPNLDSLVDGGLRFTDFHTASACSPTRSMLLSGTDHHIAGVGTMIESIQAFQRGKPGYEGYLSDSVAALPELLRDEGYLTLMSGKWHLGLTRERWPCARGFDRSYTLLPGAANHYGWEPQLRDQDELPRQMTNIPVFYAEDDKEIKPKDLGETFYSTDAFTDKMLEYLSDWRRDTKSSNDKPFFAYLTYSAPHWPLQAPDEDIEAYKGRYDQGPEHLRQERLTKLKSMGLVPDHAKPHEVIAPSKDRLLSKQWEALTPDEKQFSAKTMEAYAGMVQRMDTGIGKIIDRLKEYDELDNTFIMFMSDNGAEGHWLECIPIIKGNPFDHIAKYYDNSIGNIGRANSFVWYGPYWASAATAPGRLYKGFTAEGGIRVPLLFRYPPLTGKGSTMNHGIIHDFATCMDVAPTILELAGSAGPSEVYKGRPVMPIRGRSWVKYLNHQFSGNSSNQRSHMTIHDQDTVTGWELFGRMAVRKENWKALFIPEPYGPGRWQLYDLEKDPGETNDLADEHPSRLRMLVDAYGEYRREVGVAGESAGYGTLLVDKSLTP